MKELIERARNHQPHDKCCGVVYELADALETTAKQFVDMKAYADALEIKLEAQQEAVEQLQVQLAGCSVAALGGTNNPVKEGDYGWSPAYQDCLDMRLKLDAQQAVIDAARVQIQSGYFLRSLKEALAKLDERAPKAIPNDDPTCDRCEKPYSAYVGYCTCAGA